MDDPESTSPPPGRVKAPGSDRQQRLAAALRENLRRRKSQARARSLAAEAGPTAPAEDAAPSADDGDGSAG